MTAAPKLSDVYTLRVDMRPLTRCEPPEGTHCHLEMGSVNVTAAQAKRHAFEHPGHYVVRDTISRASFILDLETQGVAGV